jgi:hypothetical protein
MMESSLYRKFPEDPVVPVKDADTEAPATPPRATMINSSAKKKLDGYLAYQSQNGYHSRVSSCLLIPGPNVNIGNTEVVI